MAWTTVPGLAGKVYLPDDVGQTHKKHPCKACFSCQWCDENRCRVCRNDIAKSNGSTASDCCGCHHIAKPEKTNHLSAPSATADKVSESA